MGASKATREMVAWEKKIREEREARKREAEEEAMRIGKGTVSRSGRPVRRADGRDSEGRWTSWTVVSEVFDGTSNNPKSIAYCLRLLKKHDCLQAGDHPAPLIDIAARLYGSKNSTLSQKQASFVVDMIKREKLDSSLAVIFNTMEAAGEEILFDEMDHTPVETIPDRDPRGEPELESGSAALNPSKWGMF